MSVFGAPGDAGFGIHITPTVGAGGMLESVHIGTPGEGGFGIEITPMMGAGGVLEGVHFGASSAELIAQRQAKRAQALAADATRKAANREARSLFVQTQVARAGEAANAVKSAAIKAEQAPRKAACKTLPSEVIEEALEERKAMEAAGKTGDANRSPSPGRRLLNAFNSFK